MAVSSNSGSRFLFAVIVLAVIPMMSAQADCGRLGKAGRENDSRLTEALVRYTKVSSELQEISGQDQKISYALSANTILLNEVERSIDNLERAQREHCFGKQASAWENMLRDLKARRSDFEKERNTLTSLSAALQSRARWKVALEPQMKALVVCIVGKKRAALASSQRVLPHDFALIINGACKSEELALEGAQERVSGWTAQDRVEMMSGIDAIRRRAISEYTERYYRLQ
jgi:hypothetical protein